jgi:hypothetical protein
MLVTVAAETRPGERRVALTPEAVTYGSRPERAWPPWPPTTTTVRPAPTSAAVTCSRAPTWWFNPAAKTTPGAPIYGMPILEVAEAQQVVFLKRSMRPGFAGIENELLHDPRTMLLFGDAKESLTKVVNSVKGL